MGSDGDPLADRRQRAREAGMDAYADVLAVPSSYDRAVNAVTDAVETATRVRVTPEILQAARRGSSIGFETHQAIVAAFRAAGFEVED